MLRKFLISDWQYKLLALLLSISFWLMLNLGERVSISVEKNLQVINKEGGMDYKVDRKRVKLRLRVIERLVTEEMIEGIKVYADVKGLSEGEYIIKVDVYNPSRFLIGIERIEPDYVRVRVLKAPEGGQ
ncbi:MAG: hypothetical protein D6674_07965 [Acidobacteria bacterium]|jgi:YbbR domain-containing protein|nr:MAG: hypothetical protein D6674_07965 [Acidobacteriota bacterium]